MATALLVPPATFTEHATKLRARKLQLVAMAVEKEMRLRLAPVEPPQPKAAPRKDLPGVLRQFRGRLR